MDTLTQTYPHCSHRYNFRANIDWCSKKSIIFLQILSYLSLFNTPFWSFIIFFRVNCSFGPKKIQTDLLGHKNWSFGQVPPKSQFLMMNFNPQCSACWKLTFWVGMQIINFFGEKKISGNLLTYGKFRLSELDILLWSI